MAVFVKHEPCPRCGSKDNLGRYDDGSAWCFGGCGYYEKPSHSHRISKLKENIEEEPSRPTWFNLPDDCSQSFGMEACDWLGKYPVSYQKLRENGVVWSAKYQQLIYKFVVNGRLEAWQARNFAKDAKRKCFTSGEINHLMMVYGDQERRNELVVVEDPLSAIVVSQVYPCMPLLGSHLPGNKLHAIAMRYNSVIFWLDPDKYKESLDMATRTEMTGTPASAILTSQDPKCFTVPELYRIFKGEQL